MDTNASVPQTPFPFRESFETGWNLYRKNFFFLLGIVLFTFLVTSFFGGIEDSVRQSGIRVEWRMAALQTVSLVVMVFLQLGMISIVLRLHDGKTAPWGDLFSQADLILPYFGSTIFYLLAVAGGLVLFVVPGIVALISFRFYVFCMVDHRLRAVEALRQSAAVTRGYRWDLLGFFLAVLLLNLAGLAAFGVGLFVTIPVTFLAEAHAYRFLSRRLAPEEREADRDPSTVTAEARPQMMVSGEPPVQSEDAE